VAADTLAEVAGVNHRIERVRTASGLFRIQSVEPKGAVLIRVRGTVGSKGYMGITST